MPLLPIDAIKAANAKPDEPKTPAHACPCCGGRMIIIETFRRGCSPQLPSDRRQPAIRIDPHDARPQATPPQSRFLLAVLDRPRWRSPEHGINAASRSPTFDRRSSYPPRIGSLLPANHRNRRSLRCPHSTFDRPRSNPHSARGTAPSSRGFLPWRFSYAGPRSMWRRRHRAGIRRPSASSLVSVAKCKLARKNGCFAHIPLRFLLTYTCVI